MRNRGDGPRAADRQHRRGPEAERSGAAARRTAEPSRRDYRRQLIRGGRALTPAFFIVDTEEKDVGRSATPARSSSSRCFWLVAKYGRCAEETECDEDETKSFILSNEVLRVACC